MRFCDFNVTLTGKHNFVPLRSIEGSCVAKRTRAAKRNQPTFNPFFSNLKANFNAAVTYLQKVTGFDQNYPQLITLKPKHVVQVDLSTAEIWAGRASAVFAAVILAKGLV